MTHDNDLLRSRPECMVRLELLPPFALEDIKQAYATKALEAHPDHGGSIEEFLSLQDAYEAAKEYVNLRGDRRQWIAAMVERSLRQDELIAKLKQHGAQVTTTATESLERSLGDFASLVESITAVKLVNSAAGDAVIRLLVGQDDARTALRQLHLTGSQVSDREVRNLHVFVRLNHLDLRNTSITQDALSFVSALPVLTELDLRGTKVGWWARQKTNRMVRRRRAEHARREQEAAILRSMMRGPIARR